jgi:hypothetical protein
LRERRPNPIGATQSRRINIVLVHGEAIERSCCRTDRRQGEKEIRKFLSHLDSAKYDASFAQNQVFFQ